MGVGLRIETLGSQPGAAEHTNGYYAGSIVLFGSKFYTHRRIEERQYASYGTHLIHMSHGTGLTG